MFTTVRRFIKTGIAFLFSGILLGIWLLIRRELFGIWPHPYLVSAHAHAVFLGFVLFLILGVALWLFPRAPKGDRRYRPSWISTAYWILTLATTVRFCTEIARAWFDVPVLAWMVVLGGCGQALGLGVYFWTMWPRIRSVGSHLREAEGERF